MKFDTKHFGEIEINEQDVILFEEGLPGFPDDHYFVLLFDSDVDEQKSIFCWLQSVDHMDTAFVLVDVMSVIPDYTPEVSEEDIAHLGEYNPEDFVILNIAVVPADFKKTTVNLAAPLIINMKLKRGSQIDVFNDNYSIRYPLFEKLEEPQAKESV